MFTCLESKQLLTITNKSGKEKPSYTFKDTQKSKGEAGSWYTTENLKSKVQAFLMN